MLMESPGDAIRGAEPFAPETELERIERWRLHELLRAGYPVATAERIAGRHDVDLHQAIALVKDKSCPFKLAAEILL